MDKYKTLYVTNRNQWRKWLSNNFENEKEIWLILPKKSSGIQRITYNDTVEEALCFGWIDSTVRTLDEKNTIQRFTPRNPRSTYSQSNKERIKWLHSKNLLHPSVKETVKYILSEEFVYPKDIIKAIKKDKIAWINFNKYSPSYKRIRVAYIDGARNRPKEFNKRLFNFIEKTKNNKIIGYGGIDKYY
jgi:uncharacterized protein YdeI (YjbR/CyaY-like superfamily)